MPDNRISVCPSIDHKRSMIGINPELGITTTENESGQIIIEGSNESLTCLAEIILERCK
jgi:hypothetical protein